MNINNQIADMVASLLTDSEIVTETTKEKIKKAVLRNGYLTSCYGLQVEYVHDVHGKTPETSGWYIELTGTRTKVSIFIDNNLNVTRKPRNAEIVHTYSLYNHLNFNESFWDYFLK